MVPESGWLTRCLSPVTGRPRRLAGRPPKVKGIAPLGPPGPEGTAIVRLRLLVAMIVAKHADDTTVVGHPCGVKATLVADGPAAHYLPYSPEYRLLYWPRRWSRHLRLESGMMYQALGRMRLNVHTSMRNTSTTRGWACQRTSSLDMLVHMPA